MIRDPTGCQLPSKAWHINENLWTTVLGIQWPSPDLLRELAAFPAGVHRLGSWVAPRLGAVPLVPGLVLESPAKGATWRTLGCRLTDP